MSPRKSRSAKGRAGPASKKKADAPSKRKAEESDEDPHEENGEDSDAPPSPKKTPQKKMAKKGKGKKEKSKTPSKSENSKKKDEEADESEDDNEYEVENVLDVELNRAGEPKNFLVKWKGYARKDATWEPADKLDGCEEKVAEFMKKLDKLKSGSNTDERLRTERKQTKPYQDSVRNAGVRASRRFASKPRTTYHGQED